MSTKLQKHDSTAGSVRTRILRSKNRFWTAEDFDLQRSAVQRELSRLAKAGELRRMRRGLYWRGMNTRLGMSFPTPFDTVTHIAGKHGVGPASWSASLALGLSTQHPREQHYAIPTRVPTSLGKNVVLHSRASKRHRVDLKLNWREVALLESLGEWKRVVEVPREEALDRISEYEQSGDIRFDKIERAIPQEDALVRRNYDMLFDAPPGANRHRAAA